MKLEREIDIRVPPEEVYDVVMNPRRLADWVTIHVELKEAPPGVPEKGDRICQRLKLAGKGFDVRWVVTTVDPPRHVVWTGEGPARSAASAEYRFSPTDSGTRFAYALEFRLPGGRLGAFASRAVAGLSTRELDGSLEQLKALLEG